MRAFTMKILYVKTLIKVFPLEFIVKARMFEHAFLGRFRDEIVQFHRRRPQ